MANLEPLIQSIPVAPLKLASLEGCRTLADQVNNYLVSFRHESPTNVGQADSLQGYCADSYLLECECPRFGSGENQQPSKPATDREYSAIGAARRVTLQRSASPSRYPSLCK